MYLRTSLISAGLPFAVLCALSACKGEAPGALGEPAGAELAGAKAGAGAPSADCVELAGNSHCSLGAAKLELDADHGLSVSGMRDADHDGVAIHLPDVTSFVPTGGFIRDGVDAKMIARSINEGVSTSEMLAKFDGSGMSLSASFTGAGQASTYSAIYYRDGKELARQDHLANNESLITLLPCRPWPDCFFAPLLPPIFRIRAMEVAGDLGGACSWEQHFDPHSPATVSLADGQTLEVDVIELREEVPASGSYPYTSFNRIDYTFDGGVLTLSDEQVR